MKILPIGTCLLATAWLALPGRAQDDAAGTEAGQLAVSDKRFDKDEAILDKVVSEKEAIKQLVGDYRIVSGKKEGEDVLEDRLSDVTVRFTEKTITTYDGEKNARFSAAYRLDTQQRPWRVKMTSTAKPSADAAARDGATPARTTSEGLIELADGQLKIIYALPGGLAPESFQTGERQQMFVLERLAEPAEKRKEPAASSQKSEAK